MTKLEIRTTLSADEVLDRARDFFARTGSSYVAFPEKSEPGFIRFRMEVGEVIIAAREQAGETIVRGSASRARHLVSRFLTTLGSPLDLRQRSERYSGSREHGATIPAAPAADRLPARTTEPCAA